MTKKKILVTGAAGFIGTSLIKRLLQGNQGYEIIGIDCINSYYDTALKYARLAETGIMSHEIQECKMIQSHTYSEFRFIKIDIADRNAMFKLFMQEKRFDIVVNLAAQAGVRYSIENPYAYIESNIIGFMNILENCRHFEVSHLIYASSSSVYGLSDHIPYSESDATDTPVSLYAATKKADELMAHTYSHLYGIKTTGLRFFTVYGPWGRPDMAPFLFLKSILEGNPITVFNSGNLSRDFTYIDDITEGVMKIIEAPADRNQLYKIYNIGNSKPVQLMDFISVIERTTRREAKKIMTDMQPGDVYCTYADTSRLEQDFGYKPSTSIEEGIKKFYEWYISFYRNEGA